MTQHAAPLTDDERLDWLRLIRSRRVGPTTFHRLLGEHGSARAALAALPEVAAAAGVSRYEACPHDRAAAELAAGRKAGFRLLCSADPDYPVLLKAIDGAPPVLWALGDTRHAHPRCIAIVGARNASSLGTRFTRKLVQDLGQAGVTIVSGLARGIDAAAHAAALDTGTVAVQAGGLDTVYPQECAALHDDIARAGLRLSEQPLGLIPQARHFPQRNRIIAGLAQATLVIEGAARSGSLITAREAADMGREVMAVPGNPMDPRAGGCNALIRDGATLIRSAEDVLDVLDQLDTATRAAQPPLPLPEPTPQDTPDDLSNRILSLLSPTAIPEDALIRDVGLPAATVTPQLVALELQGRIARHPGGMLALSV